MNCHSINWRRHALERMFERDISRANVKEVLSVGNVIEVYDNDQPFPSKLLFAVVDEQPLHVVVSKDVKTQECYVVTAYIPTQEYFESDFTTRRKS